VIDDLSPKDPALPERFRDIHWQQLVPGGPNPSVVEMLKHAYREYQRANQAEAS
jgi:hypothetical protein